jgi:hypothetical protein
MFSLPHEIVAKIVEMCMAENPQMRVPLQLTCRSLTEMVKRFPVLNIAVGCDTENMVDHFLNIRHSNTRDTYVRELQLVENNEIVGCLHGLGSHAILAGFGDLPLTRISIDFGILEAELCHIVKAFSSLRQVSFVVVGHVDYFRETCLLAELRLLSNLEALELRCEPPVSSHKCRLDFQTNSFPTLRELTIGVSTDGADNDTDGIFIGITGVCPPNVVRLVVHDAEIAFELLPGGAEPRIFELNRVTFVPSILALWGPSFGANDKFSHDSVYFANTTKLILLHPYSGMQFAQLKYAEPCHELVPARALERVLPSHEPSVRRCVRVYDGSEIRITGDISMVKIEPLRCRGSSFGASTVQVAGDPSVRVLRIGAPDRSARNLFVLSDMPNLEKIIYMSYEDMPLNPRDCATQYAMPMLPRGSDPENCLVVVLTTNCPPAKSIEVIAGNCPSRQTTMFAKVVGGRG